MQSDFGPRIRPEEITPVVRKHLVRDGYVRELFALSCVFVPSVLISLMLSLGYRWHGEPAYNEWRLITPVAIAALLVLFGIHIWFHRERSFIKRAPATAAEVKQIETCSDLTHTQTLVIKYKPKGPGARPARAEDARVVTVAIESDLPGFNNELHEGDAISIIYDPASPGRVRVVEEEHNIAS